MAQAAKQLKKIKDIEAQALQEQKEKEESNRKRRNRSRDRKKKYLGTLRHGSSPAPLELGEEPPGVELCQTPSLRSSRNSPECSVLT
ncbi:hypothetical protein VULLAG_LOCUS4470 [Vulpes lagopus]